MILTSSNKRSAAEGVGELEVRPEGDVSALGLDRPSFGSLAELAKADPELLEERPAILGDDGRFNH